MPSADWRARGGRRRVNLDTAGRLGAWLPKACGETGCGRSAGAASRDAHSAGAPEDAASSMAKKAAEPRKFVLCAGPIALPFQATILPVQLWHRRINDTLTRVIGTGRRAVAGGGAARTCFV